MKMDICLTNVYVVTEYTTFFGGIGIKDGKVELLFKGNACPPADETIDGKGFTLMPGCIDSHVHFREPGPNAQEDFITGTKSAAAGGVTCVIDHPIDVPPVLDGASYKLKLDTIKSKAYIDYALWGGITEKSLSNLKELEELGVLAYKGFLCASDPLYPMVADGALYKAMQEIAALGAIIGLHAENNEIIQFNLRNFSNEEVNYKTHGLMRPELAELEAISRAVLLASELKARLHILHMSISRGAELIKKAKREGADVTVETCPHYLMLSEEAIAEFGPYAKCCPPLRNKANAERMWDYIFDGTIDFIVSDHSPYSFEEKERGWQDFFKAPPGLTGVQTSLQLMLSEGYHKRQLPLQKLAALMSANTAKLFGIYPQKGSLVPGADADFILVDLNAKWKITKERLYYKNNWTAFEGWEGQGKAVQTWVRGNCVYDDTKGFLQGAGYGQLVKKIRKIR